MYINISLHDYIRGITNVHHSNSTWTLDPRIEVNASDGSPTVARGVGNMVSAEFNLLYRFHSAISQRDDKWTGEFFKSIFGDKEPEKIGLAEFYQGVVKYEAGIPKEPSERVFGGMTRDSTTGKFKDNELVQILKDSIEDPAGTSLPHAVPKSEGCALINCVNRGFRGQEYPKTSTRCRDSRYTAEPEMVNSSCSLANALLTLA